MNINHHCPERCAICNYYVCSPEFLICRDCLAVVQSILTDKCPKCGNAAVNCKCGGEVRSLMFFNTVASGMFIHWLKSNANRPAVDFFAELAIRACGIKPESFDAVTYVPRLKRRIRRYGQDTAKEIARSISKKYGIPMIKTLKRKGGRVQKLLSRAERIKNVRNIYSTVLHPEEKFKRILLVDDVITTGATVSVCKGLLLKDVAGSVTVMTIAKTVIERK